MERLIDRSTANPQVVPLSRSSVLRGSGLRRYVAGRGAPTPIHDKDHDIRSPLPPRLLDAARSGDLPTVLRLARNHAGLTMREAVAEVAALDISTSTSTLSAWERGEQHPARADSEDVLHALEVRYGLPPRFLIDLARGRSLRSHVPRPAQPHLLGPFDDLYRQLGGQQSFRTVSLHEFHTVGADRRPTEHRTRQLIQIGPEPVSRYLYGFDTSSQVSVPRVTATSGCTVGRMVVDGTRHVVELLVDDGPIPAFATHLFEYRTTFDYRQIPPPQFRRGVRHRLRSLLIQVTFTSESPPVVAHRCVWSDLDADPGDRERLRLRNSAVHAVVLDPPVGPLHGVRWEWPDRTR